MARDAIVVQGLQVLREALLGHNDDNQEFYAASNNAVETKTVGLGGPNVVLRKGGYSRVHPERLVYTIQVVHSGGEVVDRDLNVYVINPSMTDPAVNRARVVAGIDALLADSNRFTVDVTS